LVVVGGAAWWWPVVVVGGGGVWEREGAGAFVGENEEKPKMKRNLLMSFQIFFF
jgi:hypothetical protein